MPARVGRPEVKWLGKFRSLSESCRSSVRVHVCVITRSCVVGSRFEGARIRRSDRERSYRLEGLVRWIRIFTYRFMGCAVQKIIN